MTRAAESPYKGETGLRRILSATRNSIAGFREALRHEDAFRQELILAAIAAPLDAFSFPSGHTLHAVAFTLVALNYYPALAPTLVAFTLLTAGSRVVLGLHYPSDVLAGAALGAGIAAASFCL